MNGLKKEFHLENITEEHVRKIEADLDSRFRKGAFRFVPDSSVLHVDFFNRETVDIDAEVIKSVIKSVDPNIEIKETKTKEIYKKVLLLENLDCANCAAKIERLAKRRFSHELLVVDFASARFIIETADRELADNLVKRVQDVVEMVDPGIKVHKKRTEKEKLTTI